MLSSARSMSKRDVVVRAAAEVGGDVVGGRGHHRAHVVRRRARPRALATAAADEFDAQGDHFGRVALLALLVLPLACLQATLDADLAALGEVLGGDFSLLAE